MKSPRSSPQKNNLKVTYYHCLALLRFRVIQQYEHHIYSESLHQEQSFKKRTCYVSISKINFIEIISIFVKIARFVPVFSASAHSYVSTPKIFRKFWQTGYHHKHLAICNRHSVKKRIIYTHYRNLNSIY